LSQLEDIQHCLTKAQEKIKQHHPWYNPFNIDWNIRPPGPQWSLSPPTRPLSKAEEEGWYDAVMEEYKPINDPIMPGDTPGPLSEAIQDMQQMLEGDV
jgi:hypothetical protein